MDVAERIVVMNAGRIEQVGPPSELYESPRNEFVMSFVGPVNRLGNAFVRPHDIQILPEPDSTSTEALVQRVVHLGFEVRVELTLPDGRDIWAQVTRDSKLQLEEVDQHVGRRSVVNAAEVGGNGITSRLKLLRRDGSRKTVLLRVTDRANIYAELFLNRSATAKGKLRASAAGVEYRQ